LNSLRTHGCNELQIQPFSVFRRRRFDKARTAPFTAVAEQGELADDEHRPADVRQRAVHFPFVIGKNPQFDDLVGQIAGIVAVVIQTHAQQYHQSTVDLSHRFAGDHYFGSVDTLDARAHGHQRGYVRRTKDEVQRTNYEL
jgi:hypothetical protein